MSIVHISEEDAAKTLGSLLTRVSHGDEIVIDGATTSVRLVLEDFPKAKMLDSAITTPPELAGERGMIDKEFAADIQFAMNRMRSLPTDSSPWD